VKLRNTFNFSFFLFALLLFASSASALPSGIFYQGREPDYVSFDIQQDGRTLTGQIDFAVYEEYPGNPLTDGDYVYAYQISNYCESEVSIDSFSLGLSEDSAVVDIGFDTTASGEIEPSYSYFSPDTENPQSALFVFFPSYLPYGSGVVKSGEESAILLFSSDNAPTNLFGVIEGGSISVTKQLPSPTPEPATVLLLGIGGAFLTLTRARRLR